MTMTKMMTKTMMTKKIDDEDDNKDDDDDGEDDDDDEYDVNCDFPSGHSSYLPVPPSSKPRPQTS